MLRSTFLAVMIAVSGLCHAQYPLFHFIDSVYTANTINESLLIKTKLFDGSYLLVDDEKVNDTVKKILYMHLLLSSNFATNGDTFGAFQIPFFWNYTDPNPRDSIFHKKRGRTLCKLPPPYEMPGYLSLASVDRVPTVFWGDFVTDEPKYSWDYLQGFYTFGWCSEREMAFKAWLGIEGIQGDICFKDNHVWTEVVLPSLPDYMLFIDNSLNRFEMRPISKRTKPVVGDKYLGWYNQNGANKITQKKLSLLAISHKRAVGLGQQIVSFFTANSDDH